MSDLPNQAFIPASGKLGQIIFENPGAGVAARLEFFIEIMFRPFEIEGKEVTPLLRINGILTDGKKWSDLAGKTLGYPPPPKPGFVDAGIPLFYVQNPAKITQINFGEIAEGKLPVNFQTVVDFAIEADSELGQIPLDIACSLDIAPLKVATSLEKQHKGDLPAITAAVADLVDLRAYGPLRKVPGGVEFSIL